MIIKSKLISEYPLTKKIECSFDCYEIIKRRYVIFLDKKVNRANMESLLDQLNKSLIKQSSTAKTLIVVGYTDEQFEKEDLLFFNGLDTFVVFYLKNDNNGEIYFNDQRVFFFSVDWKKIITKFNKILK
ncbi:MAG: hypothetical protein IKB75_06600 [Clostridia bacterium]|nr:hypothetical protein [Clostridia bacterium]